MVKVGALGAGPGEGAGGGDGGGVGVRRNCQLLSISVVRVGRSERLQMNAKD